MKFTGEKNLGIALLIIGMVITVFIQIRINAFSSLTVNVNPSPDYPRWMPLEFTYWMGPPVLIRYQEVGLMALVTGMTLLIRPFIFNHEQLKYDSEKDQRRE